MAYCFGALFAVWLLATVIQAVWPKGRVLSVLGLFRLVVPSWSFFAPNPGVHDHVLLFRDVTATDQVGPWRDLMEFHRARPVWSCIWNPAKFRRKAFFDLLMSAIAAFNELRKRAEVEQALRALQLSVPYLALLGYIDALPRAPLTVATQFLVMRIDQRSGTIEPMFMSSPHRLSSVAQPWCGTLVASPAVVDQT